MHEYDHSYPVESSQHDDVSQDLATSPLHLRRNYRNRRLQACAGEVLPTVGQQLIRAGSVGEQFFEKSTGTVRSQLAMKSALKTSPGKRKEWKSCTAPSRKRRATVPQLDFVPAYNSGSGSPGSSSGLGEAGGVVVGDGGADGDDGFGDGGLGVGAGLGLGLGDPWFIGSVSTSAYASHVAIIIPFVLSLALEIF